MVIAPALFHQVVAHLKTGFPNEACGILGLDGDRAVRWYPIANAEPSPVFYRLESQGQLRAMLEIDDQQWSSAYVHSHTRTPARPSPTDVALAADPTALYVICSLAEWDAPDLRAYRIVEGEVRELPVEVRD